MLLFVVLPIGLSMVIITARMLKVYLKVRASAFASSKWSFGVTKAGKLQKEVFWQCLSYMMAFYISWPILFSVYLASVDQNVPFGLALTAALCAPLQGFSNFLV